MIRVHVQTTLRASEVSLLSRSERVRLNFLFGRCWLQAGAVSDLLQSRQLGNVTSIPAAPCLGRKVNLKANKLRYDQEKLRSGNNNNFFIPVWRLFSIVFTLSLPPPHLKTPLRTCCSMNYNAIFGTQRCTQLVRLQPTTFSPCGGGLEYFHRSPCES
jgi:hypothetical protein